MTILFLPKRTPICKTREGHIIAVAIADVAAYVRPGFAMDEKAYRRGNSFYFPDRVVPMLPERISNELCSLHARAKTNPPLRPIFNAQGRQAAPELSPCHDGTLCIAKLSYEQAQKANGRPAGCERGTGS